jgi:hypothetical protein
VLFPSEAWLTAVAAAANRHPDLPAALSGLGQDLAAVIEADPPSLRAPVAAYARQVAGRLAEVRVLDDVDEVFELEPAYVVRAPYRVWKALLGGEDPVRAALSGRVKVEGDLQALVRRAHFRYVVDAALAGVHTEFADEGGRR